MQSARSDLARDLMVEFAARTGLVAAAAQRRYLWTDAFAVCNFLSLEHATGDAQYGALARVLVERVHHVLGRHRADDERIGWISGLADAEGELHPTAGGLRIGKPLPERRPGERLDERLEWERDGQYFHYLTKWMHALDQLGRATGEPSFNRWAHELARRAHVAFTYVPRPGARKRMYWKCSIDLSRPLVASMGQHDPLDGFVTCVQLDASLPPTQASLRHVIGDFAAMLDPTGLPTRDPLGLGGLLCDAYRVHQLTEQGAIAPDMGLLEALLAAAASGLRAYAAQPDLRLPATQRLAFRELGLALGLAAVARLGAEAERASASVRASLDRLAPYVPLRDAIETFWLDREHRTVATWREHADINDVMLATALAPDGFLVLRPAAARAA